MRFWDSSALIPLLREEPGSDGARSLMRTDAAAVVWWGTLVECTAAVAALERSKEAREIVRSAVQRLQAIGAGWLEIPPSEAIRNDARRVLRLHPLRAGDALQLAAARAVCRGDPEGFPFVCADRRLSAAAEREGFDVVDPLAAE